MIPLPRPGGDPDDVAALVLYGPARRVVVLHQDGPSHPNAIAAVERLERRGYTVVPVPRDLRRFLVGVPMLVRARVLALVAGGDGEAA